MGCVVSVPSGHAVPSQWAVWRLSPLDVLCGVSPLLTCCVVSVPSWPRQPLPLLKLVLKFRLGGLVCQTLLLFHLDAADSGPSPGPTAMLRGEGLVKAGLGGAGRVPGAQLTTAQPQEPLC